MANHKSAIKAARQNIVRRERNRAQRTRLRNVLKQARAALESEDKTASESAVKNAVILLDRSASKGIIHANAAARTKSRLIRQATAR